MDSSHGQCPSFESQSVGVGLGFALAGLLESRGEARGPVSPVEEESGSALRVLGGVEEVRLDAGEEGSEHMEASVLKSVGAPTASSEQIDPTKKDRGLLHLRVAAVRIQW